VIGQRSGSLYMLGDREWALLVDMADGTVGRILPAQSLCAHVTVSDPWQIVTDRPELPDLVREGLAKFQRERPDRPPGA
jgi:hypothetical protein